MRSREGPLRFYDIIISESAVLVNTGPIYAAVAQLDRVPDSDSGGRGFESRQPYHEKTVDLKKIGGFWYFHEQLKIGKIGFGAHLAHNLKKANGYRSLRWEQ